MQTVIDFNARKEPLEDRLLRHLESCCVGFDNRERAQDLASRFGSSVRQVQKALERLRERGTMAMSSRAHGGVFIPRCADEAVSVLGEEVAAARRHVVNTTVLLKNVERSFGVDVRRLLKPEPPFYPEFEILDPETE